MTTINAELGTSGKFVDFELTNDASFDVANAVEQEHNEDESSCCDICAAAKAGFPFSAAHLLLGATETPLLDAVTTYHRDAMYVGEQRWPKDWDAWTGYFQKHFRPCVKCGAYVDRECESCGNCLATLIPIKMDANKAAQPDDVETYPCIKINVPQWYEREDFQKWLNDRAAGIRTDIRLATWHQYDEPGEYSDIFVTYDHDEGSDLEEMPKGCWEDLCRVCKERGIKHAVLWLTNLPTEAPKIPVWQQYPGGQCPDCRQKIPRDTKDGAQCSNCGHVFWSDADDDENGADQVGAARR